MGPKPNKKEAEDTAWRTVIENAVLEEESWHLKVVFLAPAASNQDRLYLSKFESFATDEKRSVIKCIGKSETIFMVNQLGAEKKTKDENLRVFEEGQAYLKDKKDIPCDILALIIKYLILKMKEEYLFIKRQKLEVAEGLRQESVTMVNKDEVRGTVSVPRERVVNSPPPAAKGKSKNAQPLATSPEPIEGKKYNTVLRERGEEWRDRTYVDDFPVDGPNIYVAISGFSDSYLPTNLIRVGVPITAVVQIRIDIIHSEVPVELIHKTRRGQSEAEILSTEKYQSFWKDLQDIRINAEMADDLKNTAFIIFSPPYWQADQLSGDPDRVYDELTYLIYDIQDLTRQHEHYLENLEIRHIPESPVDKHYYNYYFEQMADIPLESVTIYSVLGSILQTVCEENLGDSNSNETSLLQPARKKRSPMKSTIDNDNVRIAKNLVKNVFNSLCLADSDKKKYRITYGEEIENFKNPIIIHYGDFVKYTTFHLNDLNLDKIVGSVLFGMPLHKLWLTLNPLPEEIEVKNSFHVNLLLSCFDRKDVETAELIRLIHILACRKLYNNRSSLKKTHLTSTTVQQFKKVYLKRSVLAEPLPSKKPSIQACIDTRTPSFPSITKCDSSKSNLGSNLSLEQEEQRTEHNSEASYIKSLFYCPDISELVSAAEIANNIPISHMIDAYEHFEDFSGNCAYQVLLEAFNKFNCVDYKYCEITDSIIMMFFNSHDRDGIYREEWRVHIPTPVCLQDFFDLVLEENYDWIQYEEKVYDASMMTKRSSTDQNKSAALGKTCTEDTDVIMDLILDGSLKHQDIIEAEENAQESIEKDDVSTKGSKKTSLSSSTLTGSKASKFMKRNLSALSSKNLGGDNSDLTIEKPFQGYDISDRRVEALGKDAVYFSKELTRISSIYTLVIPYNTEYISLNVAPGGQYNEIWVHRALGESISSKILDRCNSFRVNTKNNVMINIKRQIKEVPLNAANESVSKSPDKLNTNGKYNPQPEAEIPEVEKIQYYSFCITWPNGLITESIHEDDSSHIAHIKQYYLEPIPHLNEYMRCISLNGEVIIFEKSGNIQVFRPDGTCILISKYEKRQVVPIEVNIPRTEEKIKQKDKHKEKNKFKIPAPPVPEIPPVYELVIDEFEIIETTGLRQKWIGEDAYNVEKLTIRTATDYCLGEYFSRRADGTNTLLSKDGVQVVTFPDRTRIITVMEIEPDEIFPEWTEEEIEFYKMLDSLMESQAMPEIPKSMDSNESSESKKKCTETENQNERTDGYISVQITYTIEHENFTTVSIRKSDRKITVESPNASSLTVDMFDLYYKLNLGASTTASFDGNKLQVIYEACTECKSYMKCDINISSEQSLCSFDESQYWVKLKDSFCKTVVVDNEGSLNILEEMCSGQDSITKEVAENGQEAASIQDDDTEVDRKSESTVTSHGKCLDMYQAKKSRFFVMNRDLSCSELVHQSLLKQFKDCQWKPFFFMKLYDTFGDYRRLQSILKPLHLTETEKWLMDSKMSNKPTKLTIKDLKADNSGKGFYHWMRPYERFRPKPMVVDPVHSHKQPRAFVLRTLELQWPQEAREKLKGARELLTAILRYRQLIQTQSETLLNISVIDKRLASERDTYSAVQEAAYGIISNLKSHLSEDVKLRSKIEITTKSPLPSEEESVEAEFEADPKKIMEEQRASEVEAVEQVSKQSPELQRYLRRRAEEAKVEAFYRYMIREGTVPRYFQNVLGGAFWWEMNHLADEAVEIARRRKMKCVCPEADPDFQTPTSTTNIKVADEDIQSENVSNHAGDRDH